MPRREIHLYDEIGFWGERAQDFQRRLQALNLQPEDELQLNLNSPGGEVYDGLAIYAQVRYAPAARRVVRVDGLAASMGSIVAMAGDEILMTPGSMMMIHDPSGWAGGTAQDMRELADVLDKHKDALVGVYSRRTGKSADEVAQLMAAETWWTAEQAVAAGFATGVTEAPASQAVARFDRQRYAGRFRSLPQAAARYFDLGRPSAPPQERPMSKETLRRRCLMAALLADVLALAAQDTADTALSAATDGLQDRQRTLQGLLPAEQHTGSALDLLEAVATASGQPVQSLGDAQAQVLVMATRLQGAVATEEGQRKQLLDEAIKAGKIHPTHRAAWERTPLESMRATLAGMPVTAQLQQSERRPAAMPAGPSDARPQPDESYGSLRGGLGLKKEG